MKTLGLAVTLMGLVGGPLAAAPISGEDFGKVVTGRTFYYSRAGRSYGAEQYLPDHKVIWAFTGDDCLKGSWFAQGPDICFVYDGKPDPQCWQFSQDADGLKARSEGDPGGLPLIARQSSPEPMACLGPDVGV